MKLSDYGRVVTGHCRECFAEALAQAYAAGPPEWLRKDADGDFCTNIDGGGYLAWLEALPPAKCFLIENVCDFGTDEILRLCRRHLTQLVKDFSLAAPETPKPSRS